MAVVRLRHGSDALDVEVRYPPVARLMAPALTRMSLLQQLKTFTKACYVGYMQEALPIS